ncbi:MAG TPA: winged helix DNA-binding domain-containing protein [Methylomirabilota bacterium]|nr:winged helix DNA-binding domain-containing protein [Methylomirabilota bacterium]
MALEHLSNRQLNRATLARQMLLERVAMTPYDAVRDLVGLQAQTPQSWYLSLWSRLADFDPVATGRLLEERRLVRIPVMRSTIHLVTDDDALLLRSFTQPSIDRSLRGAWAQRLEGIDFAALVDEARTFVGEAPRTPADLLAHLDARWPGRDRQTMTNAVRALVPLVQVPPRGVWRRSGAVKLAALQGWIGRAMPATVDPEPVVLRYLAAFGPASVMDAQAWSGVTRLGEVFERLRPRLVTFRDDAGRELFDLPHAPRPDPDIPAPVRFLADFDNVLLSHADRSRFIGEVERKLFTYVDGPYPGMVMLDGLAVGQWHLRREGVAVTAVVRLVRPLSGSEEAAVRSEADAMLRFSVPDADEYVLELAPYGRPGLGVG